MTVNKTPAFVFTNSQGEGATKMRKFLRGPERCFVLTGKAGTGKAQPYYSKVLTPNGFIAIENINVGDHVYGKNGKLTLITGKYPQGKRQIYRVYFNDDTFVDCDKEHIWSVRYCSGNSRKAGFKNMTLSQLMEKGFIKISKRDIATGRKGTLKWEIPVCDPIQFSYRLFDINPYILGCYIGDGTAMSSSVHISNPKVDYDIIEKLEQLLKIEGYYLRKINRKSIKACPQYTFKRLDNRSKAYIHKIKRLNLNCRSADRFIPEEYFFGSVGQRMQLLKGLMDTDGTARGNRISYSTSSLQLAKDVVRLVQSVGGIAKIKKYDRIDKIKTEYSVQIRIEKNPFSLVRKSKLWSYRSATKYINRIEKLSMEDAYCIMVDNLDSLYITDNYTVTHNTTLIRYILDYMITNNDMTQVMGIALAHKAKEKLRESIPYVNTFASAFGLRKHTDKVTGEVSFIPKAEALVKADCQRKWKVVVIDECSQFSREMLKMVFNLLDNNTKLIFMGDRGQLPPIQSDKGKESDSDSPIFEANIPDFCRHELIERVRQTEGNPIIDLSDVVYDEIFGGRDIYKVMRLLKEIDIDSSNEYGFQPINRQDMYDKFTNRTENNFLDTKLLAYRNATVDKSNEYLRNYIHYNPTSQYIKGEIIYMNQTYTYNDGMISHFLHNSSEHIIKGVQQGELDGIPVHELLVEKGFMQCLQAPHDSMSMKMYYAYIKDFNARKDWVNKSNFMEQFADISYGYTLTTHKAQGSGYDNVFIDTADIFAVKMITHKRKLQALYTSITRAAKRLYLIQ